MEKRRHRVEELKEVIVYHSIAGMRIDQDIKKESITQKDFPDISEEKKPHPRVLEINKELESMKELGISRDEISDGYHSFKELYDHRMVLFSIICNQNKDLSWKSKKHFDGGMYTDYFIVGIETKEGQFTYHYPLENWDMFNVKTLERAPLWDGHQSKDIKRLLTLI